MAEFLASLCICDTMGFILSVPEIIILDRMGPAGTAPCFFLLHLVQVLKVLLSVQLYILSMC